MNRFQHFEDQVNTFGLVHHPQITLFDCSSACLRMLSACSNRGRLLPPTIPTDEIPLYAARLGVYLRQRSVLESQYEIGVYLCMQKSHWFLIHVLESFYRVHDPLKPEVQTFTTEEGLSPYKEVTIVFQVYFVSEPVLNTEPL